LYQQIEKIKKVNESTKKEKQRDAKIDKRTISSMSKYLFHQDGDGWEVWVWAQVLVEVGVGVWALVLVSVWALV